MEGQRYSKRLNERQITALLKVTCQRPVERERDIMQVVDVLGLYCLFFLNLMMQKVIDVLVLGLCGVLCLIFFSLI